MPMTPELDEELGLILEALDPEIKHMGEVPAGFVTEQTEKYSQYGKQLFISPKQIAWLRRLYVEYVGPLDHLPLSSRGARDDLIGDDDD